MRSRTSLRYDVGGHDAILTAATLPVRFGSLDGSKPLRTGKRARCPITRIAASLAVALLVGVAVTMVVSAILFGPGIEFWGLVDGSVAGLVTFGVLLAVRSKGVALRRAGAALLFLVLGLVAFALIWWIAAWGVPLGTLEGLWLWPTAAGFTIGALLALRWLVRIRPRPR